MNTLPCTEIGNRQVNKLAHTTHTKCCEGNKWLVETDGGEGVGGEGGSVLVRILTVSEMRCLNCDLKDERGHCSSKEAR